MEASVNWKLISSVAIPSGLVSGWVFGQGWNRLTAYIVFVILMGITGLAAYKLSETNKKISMFNSVVMAMAVASVIRILRQL